MDVVLSIATLAAGIRLALPVALAALGALLSERAGVLNLGLEGLMVSGALAGYLATHHSGSPWVGLGAGLITGALCGALISFVVVGLRANQIVTGLAFTLLAGAATSFIFQHSFGVGENPPRIPRIGMPVLIVLTLVVLVVIIAVLRGTVAGLVVSAVGESPVAADALGYRVLRTRYLATIAG